MLGPAFVVAAAFLVAPCLSPAHPPAPAPDATFSIAVERAGETLLLRVVLENKGSTPVWSYALLDFEERDCRRLPQVAVQISLHDARGRSLQSRCRPVAAYRQEEHRTLGPGERLAASFALTSCYDMQKGETIALGAFYGDPSVPPRPPPPGVRALPPRIDAASIKFTVP